jgi:hypothetical protein
VNKGVDDLKIIESWGKFTCVREIGTPWEVGFYAGSREKLLAVVSEGGI